MIIDNRLLQISLWSRLTVYNQADIILAHNGALQFA